MSTPSPVELADLFTDPPDWFDFTAIPVGAAFNSRRGLPYRKSGRGEAEPLFCEDDVDIDDLDDEDVFADWPYFELPTASSQSELLPGGER